MSSEPEPAKEPLLQIHHLRKYFPVTRGLALQRTVGWVKAVDDVSLVIRPGTTVSLVGESGAGKTTVTRMALLLEKPTSGSIIFQGRDIRRLSRAGLAEYRSSVQAVFQDPWSSMNPRMRVRSIVAEPLVVDASLTRKGIRARVLELLAQVGLRADHAELYPHEFSGGQRQRIAVARSLALHPKLIILDEPVSALDVSIRAQILNLLKDLQTRHALSYLLIAHNLATVRYMSHAIGIMHLGEIVEFAEGEELFTNPLHPYTKALMEAAMPGRPGDGFGEVVLTEDAPSPLNPPSGCRFHPRCPEAKGICSRIAPAETLHSSSHRVRCHLY